MKWLAIIIVSFSYLFTPPAMAWEYNRGNDYSGSGMNGGDEMNMGDQPSNDDVLTRPTEDDGPTRPGEESNSQRRNRLRFSIAPALYFNLNIDKKLVNLTQHPNNIPGPTSGPNSFIRTNPDLQVKSSTRQHVPTILEMDQTNRGFRFNYETTLNVGAGFMGLGYLKDASQFLRNFHIPIGILVHGGVDVKLSKRVQNKAEADKIKRVYKMFPYKATDLIDWAPGDSMYYETKGGVSVFGGVGLSALCAQAGYSYTESSGPRVVKDANPGDRDQTSATYGKWVAFVQKRVNNKVFVELKNKEVETAGVYCLGSYFLHVDASNHDKLEGGWSFIFDLNDSSARAAYQDMLSGNIRTAQKLIDRANRVPTVEHATSFLRGETDKTYKIRGPIPMFFSFKDARGFIHNSSSNDWHLRGVQDQTEQVTYLSKKAFQYGWMKDTSFKKSFTGSFVTMVDQDNNVRPTMFGEVVVGAYDEKTTEKDFYDNLNSILLTTGMIDQLGAVLEKKNTGDLGYTNIKMKLAFPESATTFITRLGPSAKAKYIEAAEQIIANHWSNHTEIRIMNSGLCADFEKWRNGGIAGDENLVPIKECLKAMKNDTKAAVNKMIDAAMDMSKAKNLFFSAGRTQDKQKQAKAFSNAYAEFGQAMLRNMFSFQTALKMLENQKLALSYVIEGERISQFIIGDITKANKDMRRDQKNVIMPESIVARDKFLSIEALAVDMDQVEKKVNQPKKKKGFFDGWFFTN